MRSRSSAARAGRGLAGALVGMLLLASGACAGEAARILVQASPLAGFRHHAGPAVWDELAVGDALALIREADNPHDRRAVRVEWRGVKLGYIPREANAALAWAMDRGERVSARIAQLRAHPNPRSRVLIEVFAD